MNPLISPVVEQINRHLLGKEYQIKQSLCCILANGHLLIEDVPGVGKTTLAHALATTLGLTYQRVQFTSDMLPADLLGVSIFDSATQQFVFHRGPVFSQLLLADEINRTSPKTQSALLEAMAERQISIDGETYALPDPFFVIATQNPLDHSGTYELPESQFDRFMMRVSLGFPSADAEKRMLKGQAIGQQQLKNILNPGQLKAIQAEAARVTASDAVLDYLLALVGETRTNHRYPHPLSPRASAAILAAARGWAFIDGRKYVLPEDIQAILPAVAEHRLRGAHQQAGQPLSELLLQSIDPLA